MAVMGVNQLINTGAGLFMDHGLGHYNILPPGVKPGLCIEKVEHFNNHMDMKEIIMIKFKNGHTAGVEVDMDNGRICPEKLKEFQATCIMVHDI